VQTGDINIAAIGLKRAAIPFVFQPRQSNFERGAVKQINPYPQRRECPGKVRQPARLVSAGERQPAAVRQQGVLS
jgi:hypothetical protein